ncbi:MAG: ChbG/HpnK family deacetylase [Acidimicrobiales bacterium]
MTRLLIVNADDYGLTRGVSRAIIGAHRDGIVTSTSALAIGPAFAATAPWLLDVPRLGIGAHLAIVGEDPPLLTAREIPTLVDKRGRLRLSWRQLLPRAAAGRIDPAEVEREMAAQLDAVIAAVGAERVTHLDTHQHLHLWPSIGKVVVALAQRVGIAAVRVTRSRASSPAGRGVNALSARFERSAAKAGLARPAAFAGFDEGGRLAEPDLVAVIAALGASGAKSAELGIHPGETGDADLDRYRWGYRWGEELAALVSPSARRAVEASGFTLATFAALAAR